MFPEPVSTAPVLAVAPLVAVVAVAELPLVRLLVLLPSLPAAVTSEALLVSDGFVSPLEQPSTRVNTALAPTALGILIDIRA
jgi:hypothetical protein